MPRPSKVNRLDAEVRDLIRRLRENGHSIDEIKARLETLDLPPDEMPSRTGLGREVQKIDAVLEMVRSSRDQAEALVPKIGEAAEGRQARANIELMQALVMQLLVGAAGGGVKMTAKEAGFYAKTLADLSRAQKTDIDTIIRLKRELAAEMEKKLSTLSDEVAASAAPPTPEEMIRRIRALYAGEG